MSTVSVTGVTCRVFHHNVKQILVMVTRIVDTANIVMDVAVQIINIMNYVYMVLIIHILAMELEYMKAQVVGLVHAMLVIGI